MIVAVAVMLVVKHEPITGKHEESDPRPSANSLEPCMGFGPIPSETQSEMLPLHQARPYIRERCTGILTPRQALMVFPFFSGCPSRNRTYILRVKVWYPTIRRPGRNFLVVVVGLEPTTSPLSGECSNQLSYTTTKKFGSHGRTRTCNHPVNSRKLYH